MTKVRIMKQVKEGCKELFELGEFEVPYVPGDYDRIVVDEKEYRVAQTFLSVSTTGDDPLVALTVKTASEIESILERSIWSKLIDFHWNHYWIYTPLTLATLYAIHRLTT